MRAIVHVTDDTNPGSPEDDQTMTMPVVTERPLRLTPVDRDTFCTAPVGDWTPPRRRPLDA
jgi:hypothetical protein